MNNFIGQFLYPFTIVKQINQRDIEGLKKEQKLTEQRYLNDPKGDQRSDKCYWKDRSERSIFHPFEKSPNSHYKTWLLGECIECGNYHWMFSYNFQDNHAQTCPFCKASGKRKDPYVHYEKGKILHPRNDLRGLIFGDLLVNDKEPVDFGNGHCTYEVTCLRCGKNVFNERDDYLTILKHSCCDECKSKKSALEELVASILKRNNISYTYEKKFDDLLGTRNGKLSYDFYINKNDTQYLIEIQGVQHYQPVDYFGGEEKFKIQQEHDKRKKDYAILNNFKLIEIPYNAKNIEQYLIDIL